jgi:hypothetical protein
MRIVVVFPAPLGPRKPKISPLFTLKETWSTAVIGPYDFVRACTSINAFLRKRGTQQAHLLNQKDSYIKKRAKKENLEQ